MKTDTLGVPSAIATPAWVLTTNPIGKTVCENKVEEWIRRHDPELFTRVARRLEQDGADKNIIRANQSLAKEQAVGDIAKQAANSEIIAKNWEVIFAPKGVGAVLEQRYESYLRDPNLLHANLAMGVR